MHNEDEFKEYALSHKKIESIKNEWIEKLKAKSHAIGSCKHTIVFERNAILEIGNNIQNHFRNENNNFCKIKNY